MRAALPDQHCTRHSCCMGSLLLAQPPALLQPFNPTTAPTSRTATFTHAAPRPVAATALACHKFVQQAAQAPHVAGGAHALHAPPVVVPLLLVSGPRPDREHLRGLEAVGATSAGGECAVRVAAAGPAGRCARRGGRL